VSGFVEVLSRGGFPASLEVTPPRKPRADILLRRARMLGSVVDAVNVVQRAGRVLSLDAAIELQKSGVAAFWHLTNRGRSRDQIASDIAMAGQMDISLVLCIRGDHADPEESETPKIREVVAMVREALPHSLIGVTMNQYGPRDRVLRNLMPKLEAGADLVQTQPVFDLKLFDSLAREVLSEAPDVRIMPMVMPLLSTAEAKRLQRRLEVALPDDFLRRLEAGDETVGWETFGKTLEALSSGGLAHAVAVMTLMTDPPEPVAARIAAALRSHT
jgi:5,10-methylenetetrahydrofolate reductase